MVSTQFGMETHHQLLIDPFLGTVHMRFNSSFCSPYGQRKLLMISNKATFASERVYHQRKNSVPGFENLAKRKYLAGVCVGGVVEVPGEPSTKTYGNPMRQTSITPGLK